MCHGAILLAGHSGNPMAIHPIDEALGLVIGGILESVSSSLKLVFPFFLQKVWWRIWAHMGTHFRVIKEKL